MTSPCSTASRDSRGTTYSKLTSGWSWRKRIVRSAPSRVRGQNGIADRLQAHDPQLERFTTGHQIALTRLDGAGVQVSLFERELAVTVAYWHTGRAAQAVMELVWSYLAILEQETGWEIYDPQLGRSLDQARDLDAVSGGHADM